MAGQTIVEYGAVSMFQCLTVRISQREERDSSGADTMFQRYELNVVGYVHGRTVEDGSPKTTPNGSDVGDTYEGISEILAAPRLNLKYRVGCNASGGGGVTVFDVQPASSTGAIENNRDLDNGPRCTVFDVNAVVADQLWRVEATFVFSLPTCSRR